MSCSLEITLSRAGSLTDSPPEESASFGLLSVRMGDRLLTEAVSREREGAPPAVCEGPHVAGYSLAEWLVWNWWRLHWDEAVPPRHRSDARSRWDFSHCIETVGDGYVWPSITVAPEGEQTRIISEPSLVSDGDPFRYIASTTDELVPTSCFTAAVDEFVRQVLSRLGEAGLSDTNLHRLQGDLAQERDDPEITRFRRAEARLALDPDEASEEVIWRCLDDARALGESSWGELAAEAAYHGTGADDLASADGLRDIAASRGFITSRDSAIERHYPMVATGQLAVASEDSPTLVSSAAPSPAVPPWRVGADMAQRIRNEERLDGQPLSDVYLCGFVGLPASAITQTHRRGDRLSYALAEDETRVVLSSKHRTGRRFELARLLGDRLLASMHDYDGALFPATRAYTYRQKAQRAFAAELLSPFHAVEDFMSGDYSANRQQEVARHFRVSEMTIRTQLVNRGLLPREDAPDVAWRGPALD